MIPENVSQSVDAAEKALSHFVDMLELGGFESGAGAYDSMADVIVSQALMLQSQGEHDLDERFETLEHLARRIHEQLYPYVSVMQRLMALQEILPSSNPAINPDSIPGQILATLASKERPMSVTAIRSSIGGSSKEIREEVLELVEAGLLEQMGSTSRPVYALTT